MRGFVVRTPATPAGADAVEVGASSPDGVQLRTALRVARRFSREVRHIRAPHDGNTVVVLTDEHVVRVGRAWPLTTGVEVRCWAAALAAGVPAPRVVDHGELHGTGYLVYRRMAGWPPDNPAAVRRAGALLGRLHGIDPAGFPPEQLSRPRRRRRYQLAAAAVGSCVAAGSRAWVRRLLRAANGDWSTRRDTATHGDFRHQNLLAVGQRVVGVLDWSDARRASPESDLGQVDLRDQRCVLAGHRETSAREVNVELVAGHSIARFLAMESSGVLGPGRAQHAVSWWRANLATAGRRHA